MAEIQSTSVVVRKAAAAEVEAITQLIYPFVAERILLPRSPEQILADLSLTWVAVAGDRVVGVVNLTPFEPDLFEVRGLAVDADFHGDRIGKRLVEQAVGHLASIEGQHRVFALTYIPAFFEKLGFIQVEKERFPAKIYDVCNLCTRQADCSEIAMELATDG